MAKQRLDHRYQHEIIGFGPVPPRAEFLVTASLPDAARGLYGRRGQAMAREPPVGIVIPLEEKASERLLEPLIALVASDMALVNRTILSRASSDVSMIPEVANHLISSGGKRLRPILTLATAGLCGYRGEGHIKLAAAVEFMHTATLLHDDVVDESDLRRGAAGRSRAVGERGQRAGRRLPARPGFQDDGGGRLAALPRRAFHRRGRNRGRRGDATFRLQGHDDDRGRLSRGNSRQDGGAVLGGVRGRPDSRQERQSRDGGRAAATAQISASRSN